MIAYQYLCNILWNSVIIHVFEEHEMIKVFITNNTHTIIIFILKFNSVCICSDIYVQRTEKWNSKDWALIKFLSWNISWWKDSILIQLFSIMILHVIHFSVWFIIHILKELQNVKINQQSWKSASSTSDKCLGIWLILSLNFWSWVIILLMILMLSRCKTFCNSWCLMMHIHCWREFDKNFYQNCVHYSRMSENWQHYYSTQINQMQQTLSSLIIAAENHIKNFIIKHVLDFI